MLKAQASGNLSSKIPPKLLASTIVAMVEGAIMMSRVSKRKQDLRDFLTSIKTILDMKLYRLVGIIIMNKK